VHSNIGCLVTMNDEGPCERRGENVLQGEDHDTKASIGQFFSGRRGQQFQGQSSKLDDSCA